MCRDLTPDQVAARVVVLFTIGETPWSTEQRAALLGGVRAGTTSLVVVHSGLDACLEWPEYGPLIGARFDGHPMTGELPLEVVDHDHPATAHLDADWRWTDELYTFRDLNRDVRVLIRVPPERLDLGDRQVTVPEFGFPLSWCARGRGSRVHHRVGTLPGGVGVQRLPGPRGRRPEVGPRLRRQRQTHDRKVMPSCLHLMLRCQYAGAADHDQDRRGSSPPGQGSGCRRGALRE